MLKKVSYVILVVIIIVGIAMAGFQGFNKDVQYKANATIYVQIGKEFSVKDMKQIAKEVFEGQRVSVQVVELYKDMVSFTVEEASDEELEPKIEELNNKINEKYELENSVEDISTIHSPKVRLLDFAKPYIGTMATITVLVFIYGIIRYRKLGVFKTLWKYVVGVVGVELLYVSLLAITRFPINQFVIPIGLFIYTLAILVVTVKRENKLSKLQEQTSNETK